MAAVSGLTGLTVIDDVVNSEWISQQVHAAVANPLLYNAITRLITITQTRTYAHPIWAEMAAATALTESDEVASTALSSTEVTVSPALNAKATFVSEQALGAGVLDVLGLASDRVLGAVRRKIDNDVLALATSITSSAGSNATTNDVSNLNIAITAFRTVVKGNLAGNAVAIMHGDALRDLGEDAVNTSNSLFGSAVGENLFGATQQVQAGQFAQFGKISLVSHDGVPVGDTTGWTNMIIDAGGMDTLFGLVVTRGLRLDLWAEPKRFGVWVIGSSDHAAGILDQGRGHAFITKT